MNMKPSEIVMLFAFHPMYNPEGLHCGTRYLCNVGEHLGEHDQRPSHEEYKAFRDTVEMKLDTLRASVLANHFRYNLGVYQTLENSQVFWTAFAKELEDRGL